MPNFTSSAIFDNNADAIGNTPLIRLNRLMPQGVTVLAKIESRNPAFSVKDRIGAGMISDAEQSGKLKAGMHIVEATSGNTGIALAFVAAAKGYPITLTMPSSMSMERRKTLIALGANLVLTDPALGMKGAVEKAHEIVNSDPDKYFLPKQFDNPANPAIHIKTTAPEIDHATAGNLDAFVAGVGTGGTVSGVAKYFKDKGQNIHIVAVEPTESPIITQALQGENLTPGPHKIQGIGANFIPKNLALDLLDEVIGVTSDDALAWTRRAMTEEGILCGISSGAALKATYELASRPEFQGKTIVVVLPDGGERYLSSVLFDGVFTGENFA
ncbi:subunit of cysteine synthase A and O-acetylserine sulfhydrolase A, PLP-dependent enzyme [Moraxella macacae 0408225]|uniref:Cysteine synthase n=1 Tax=Moraxella macacae 0408225 TaxID=1230338 RepID=L2F5H2_9GAMM|nr:cysteine synthase A [Moraxella macacae]ELA08130.1 subunit of cysteine synthase A and O-acetylserine sulfhydrolase A, PLP-dependent enzyme [Moraxella macacae 0408225]